MVGGLKPPTVEAEELAVKAKGQGVIFVLEEAQLEVAQVGKVSSGCRQELHCHWSPSANTELHVMLVIVHGKNVPVLHRTCRALFC